MSTITTGYTKDLTVPTLAAAIKLIADRGLAPITMTDIAEEASMALPAVYCYFPNKQAIVRELTLSSFAADAEMTSAVAADWPGLDVPRLVLERHALVLVEILDGLIGLASRVDDAEADAVIQEFAQVAASTLFRGEAEDTP